MIQNNIQFDLKNEDYVLVNKKISRDSYTKIQAGKNNPIINAVSIDWNNAQVDDNIYINTTGELLYWIKNLNSSNKNNLTDEQLEALNYVVEFVKQIKGKQQIINEDDYLIYIGVDRPDENTDPLKDLSIHNQILNNTSPMGWRSIGQDISIYNANNPAFYGGGTPVCLNINFNNVSCYVAIPVGMGMYDGLGNDLTTAWTLDQENVTIKGHQYNVYVDELEGEFTAAIY